jgi:hypothetical protein
VPYGFLTGKDFRTPAYGSGRVAGNLQPMHDELSWLLPGLTEADLAGTGLR